MADVGWDGDIDLHRVLGVPPAATLGQIKAGYRRRAVRHHPDRNGGSKLAEEQFKRCNAAYATLSDPERRAAYEAQVWAQRSPMELVGGLLDHLLSEPGRRRRRGRDIWQTVELTLEQAARDARVPLEIVVDELCRVCGGSGSAPDGRARCSECRGKGELPRHGLLALPRICVRCGGQGTQIVNPCSSCGGVGMVEQERQVFVTLPVGCSDGDVHVLPGQGEPGLYGGETGDLRVVVKVLPHLLLERDGIDLRIDVPVSFCTAALGGAVTVPTLDGNVRVQIPAGTQSGHILRVRGRGIQGGGRRGDILVRVTVETPTDIKQQPRHLIEQLAQVLDATSQPRQQDYAARIEQWSVQRSGKNQDER